MLKITNNAFSNLLISSVKESWYRKIEPIKLAKLRHQYEKFYGPDEPNPKVFIFTPTYNRANLLQERAIKSVLTQTYKNFTYLIVGDCCTDHTAEIFKNIDDPRVQFINLAKRGYRYPPTPENHWFSGPIVASNTALDMVPSDCSWIARVDDDDTWVPDHLEASLKFALSGNYELVTSKGDQVRYGVVTEIDGQHLYGSYFKEPLPNLERYVYNPKIGSASNVLYRSYLKHFKYNLDCWRGKHNKPNELNLFHRLGVAGVRIGFLNKITFHYIPRPNDETVGLEAYRANAQGVIEHYNFH